MADWSADLYSTFIEWRTRPSRDLVQRVNIAAPSQIVDLGCGPGNSTAVCAERWPTASILGLDSSPDMISAARAAKPEGNWLVADVGEWAAQPSSPKQQVDVIFSSAALQWIPDHASLFPRLLGKLAPGGYLAVQMPAYDAIPNQTMRHMASSERWSRWFPDGHAQEWLSHSLQFYHSVLARRAKSLDLWATDYLQIMPDVDGIVEWYKSTGLRPYLDAIDDEEQRQEFLCEFRARLEPLYPALESGNVPFHFRRIFLVAGV